MRRTYRVPARVDDVDDHVQTIFSELGAHWATPLNQAGTVEAVLNAMIHGIFRVPSGPERDPIAFLDALRAAESEHSEEEVSITVEHSRESDICSIIVSDPGDGFDVDTATKRMETIDPLSPSGRGLLLMNAAAESVTWNPSGNEVTLSFRSSAPPASSPASTSRKV